MQILGLLGMYFDAAVVFVNNLQQLIFLLLICSYTYLLTCKEKHMTFFLFKQKKASLHCALGLALGEAKQHTYN